MARVRWCDIVSSEGDEPVTCAMRYRFRTNKIVVLNMDTFTQTVIMTHSNDTTDKVKAKIQDKWGIPPEHQRLLLRTSTIVNGVIWNQLRAEQGEVVLHVSDVRGMQVFVRDLDGHTCIVDCVPTLTVQCFKVRIISMLALRKFIPNNMRLTFAGRRLENNRLLCEYGVENEISVHMSLNLDGGSMPPIVISDDESEEIEQSEYEGESETDSTASANSLQEFNEPIDSDNDGGLFNHELLRMNQELAEWTAQTFYPSPDDEEDSQATTIRFKQEEL